MAGLVSELRVLTDTAVDDVLLQGTYYWTDDQLQDILDQNSIAFTDIPLISRPLWYSGSRQYLEYHFPGYVSEWLEEPTASDNRFQIVDSLGNETAIANYTLEARYKRVTFNSDQASKLWYLRARGYNLYQAASEVWQRKAALRAELIEVRGGIFIMKEDQEYKHCIEQARFFAGRGGFNTIKLIRTGYNL